ncbi:MAG: pyrroline-5-carboxylate reductase family protein [Oscillospiraceae bacterium]
MAEYKMGFIGTGNMGSALARAAAKSGERMLLANRTPEKAEALAAVLGAKVGTNLQAAAACEYIFLGVKPQMLPALLDELRPALLNQGPTVFSSSRWRPGSRPGRSGRRWALTARSCGSCRTCRSPAARA